MSRGQRPPFPGESLAHGSWRFLTKDFYTVTPPGSTKPSPRVMQLREKLAINCFQHLTQLQIYGCPNLWFPRPEKWQLISSRCPSLTVHPEEQTVGAKRSWVFLLITDLGPAGPTAATSAPEPGREGTAPCPRCHLALESPKYE